jgi:hypothetical protein
MKRKIKFETPKHVAHEKDQYGCTGFWSYGMVEDENGEFQHVKNPDFNWNA